MKFYSLFIPLIFCNLFCSSALACKVAVNFEWSKTNVANLLSVAEKTGAYEGYSISRIELHVGRGAETIIELKKSPECKRLIFSSIQPMCQVEYKFIREELCSAK